MNNYVRHVIQLMNPIQIIYLIIGKQKILDI